MGRDVNGKFRKIIFWLHLIAGVVAGIVIFIMSATGVALAFHPEIVAWADRDVRRVTPPNAEAKPLELGELLAKLREQRPGERPSNILLEADPTIAVAVSYGGTNSFYVNPYSGEMRARGAQGVRDFMQLMIDWHRFLGGHDEKNRAVGKAITGACNVAFLFLAGSGLYLWWPRQWTKKIFAAVGLMNFKLRGKARDFNWHHAAGIWSVVAILTMSTTGLVMSYRWANSLVYRLVGEATPVRSGGPGGPRPAGPLSPPPPLAPILAAVSSTVPNWESITVPLANQPNAPLELTVLQQGVALPAARHTLAIDRTTYRVVRHDQFTDGSPGRRLRAMLRFLHTGQALGLAGQVVAGLGCVAALVLLYTGWALPKGRGPAARVG